MRKIPEVRQIKRGKIAYYERGFCVLCEEGAWDHRNVPCPVGAIERLTGTESVINTESVGRWTRYAENLLWSLQKARQARRSLRAPLIAHIDCAICRKVNWFPGESEKERHLGWRCRSLLICKKCGGYGITGGTPEERVAQRLGGFGVCPECEGRPAPVCNRFLRLEDAIHESWKYHR